MIKEKHRLCYCENISHVATVSSFLNHAFQVSTFFEESLPDDCLICTLLFFNVVTDE